MSLARAASVVILLTGCAPLPRLAAVPASPTTGQAMAQVRALTTKFDDYLKAAVRFDAFSGTILIAKDGNVIFGKSYGMANFELNVPTTAATTYQIQSITKPFTAISIMMLQEEGKLNVNDPICNHLDNCPDAWRPITIHHLLTHTSGIEGYSRLADWDETLDSRTYWRGGPVGLVRYRPLRFRPGEKYDYSNSGYVLLARIIERRSGKTLPEFFQQRIFSPLGMTHSGFTNSRLLVPNLATGYYSLGTSFINAPTQSRTGYGDGGIYSTVGDLLIWDQALYSNKLISAASYAQMIAHHTNDYGYGWELRDWFGRREFGHAGSGEGFSSFIARFIDDRLTVIVLSNSDEASAGGTARSLAAIYLGEQYALPTLNPFAVYLDVIAKEGVDAGIARYREQKQAQPAAAAFQNDEMLLELGFEFVYVPMMDKALQIFEFAIQEFPQSPDGYTGLAIIAVAEGDYEAAIRHLETSLKLDPNDQYALEQLPQLRQLLPH